MKLFCNAFAATLQELDIRANALSEVSGVSEAAISNFRNDTHAVTTDNLERLIAALDDKAFEYWISQIVTLRGLEEIQTSPTNLSMFVDQLDGPAATELLVALAARLRKEARRKVNEPVIA